MIVFDLQCKCGCQFEGWFAGRVDFDRQNDLGLIACPRCGGEKVRKILSPVAVYSGCGGRASKPAEGEQEITPATMVRFLRTVRHFVEKNFDDVGPRLAEESLKMRYGVSEPRNIRGTATADQEIMLREEGIELLHIPLIGKDPSEPKPN